MSINVNVGGNTGPLERDVRAAMDRINRAGGLKIRVDDKGVTQPLGNMKRSADEFSKSLEASNARVLAFGASVGIINAVSNAFKGLVEQTIKVEKNLTDINVVMGLTAKQLDKFGGGLFKVAAETGAGFQAASEAATEFARQGLSVAETLKRTKDALILTRLTGMKATESVKSLTAAMNTFKGEVHDSTVLVSKFAAVDVKFAVSAEDFAQAIARAGASARDAGVDINELIGIVTAVQERTARGGAVIGNAFKTIFTRLRRGSTLQELENIGIAVRDMKGATLPAMKILDQLAKRYDTLTDSQKSYVSQNVAGVFQINMLKAAMADLGQANSVTAQATAIASRATDESNQKNEQLRSTMAALATETGVAIQELAKKIGDIALAPGINKILDGVKGVADWANNLLGDGEQEGNRFAKGLLAGVGNFLSGPGLVVLTAVVSKLFVNAAKYGVQSLQSLLGMNKAATARKHTEQAILQVMASNSALSKEMLRTDISREKKEQMILALIRQQTTEAQKLAAVSKQLTLPLVRAGVTPNLSMRRAEGFIPNFAADKSERQLAQQAGYSAGAIKQMNIPGVGDVTYNTAETVKKFPGMTQPAIMPPEESRAAGPYNAAFMGAHGFSPYAAAGHIPNFAIGSATLLKSWSSKGRDAGDRLTFNHPNAINYAERQGYIASKDANNLLKKYASSGSAAKMQQSKAGAKSQALAAMLVPKEGYGGPSSSYRSKTTGNLTWPVYKISSKGKMRNANIEKALMKRVDDIGGDYTLNLSRTLEELNFGSKMGAKNAFSRKWDNDTAGGATGAVGSMVGSIFEAATNAALNYSAQDFDGAEGDFDVRGGEFAKIRKAFKIEGGALKYPLADFKNNSMTKGNRKSFHDKVVKQNKFNKTNPGGPKNAAKISALGYVPNYADPLSDAIGRERGAGVPVSKIRVGSHRALQASSNPMGLGVTNTADEPRGLKDVFGASGFVPNYANPAKFQKGDFAISGRNVKYQKKLAKQANKEMKKLIQKYKMGTINQQTLNTSIKNLAVKSKNQANVGDRVAKEQLRSIGSITKLTAWRNRMSQMYKKTSFSQGMQGGAGGGIGGFIGRTQGGHNWMGRTMNGMGGMGAMMALSMGAGMMGADEDPTNTGKQQGAGMMTGASTGMAIGMMFGPLGMALGGATGAILGFMNGTKKATEAMEQKTEAERQSRIKAAGAQGSILAERVAGFDMNNTRNYHLRGSGGVDPTLSTDLTKEELQSISGGQMFHGGSERAGVRGKVLKSVRDSGAYDDLFKMFRTESKRSPFGVDRNSFGKWNDTLGFHQRIFGANYNTKGQLDDVSPMKSSGNPTYDAMIGSNGKLQLERAKHHTMGAFDLPAAMGGRAQGRVLDPLSSKAAERVMHSAIDNAIRRQIYVASGYEEDSDEFKEIFEQVKLKPKEATFGAKTLPEVYQQVMEAQQDPTGAQINRGYVVPGRPNVTNSIGNIKVTNADYEQAVNDEMVAAATFEYQKQFLKNVLETTPNDTILPRWTASMADDTTRTIPGGREISNKTKNVTVAEAKALIDDFDRDEASSATQSALAGGATLSEEQLKQQGQSRNQLQARINMRKVIIDAEMNAAQQSHTLQLAAIRENQNINDKLKLYSNSLSEGAKVQLKFNLDMKKADQKLADGKLKAAQTIQKNLLTFMKSDQGTGLAQEIRNAISDENLDIKAFGNIFEGKEGLFADFKNDPEKFFAEADPEMLAQIVKLLNEKVLGNSKVTEYLQSQNKEYEKLIDKEKKSHEITEAKALGEKETNDTLADRVDILRNINAELKKQQSGAKFLKDMAGARSQGMELSRQIALAKVGGGNAQQQYNAQIASSRSSHSLAMFRRKVGVDARHKSSLLNNPAIGEMISANDQEFGSMNFKGTIEALRLRESEHSRKQAAGDDTLDSARYDSRKVTDAIDAAERAYNAEQKITEELDNQQKLREDLLKIQHEFVHGQDAFANGMQMAFKDANDRAATFSHRLGKVLPETFAKNMSDAMMKVIREGSDWEDALRGAAIGVLDQLNQMFTQQMMDQAFGSMFDEGEDPAVTATMSLDNAIRVDLTQSISNLSTNISSLTGAITAMPKATVAPALGTTSGQVHTPSSGSVNENYHGGPVRLNKGGQVPSMLTNGEFVMGKEAVSRLGIGSMAELNQGRIPKFNQGGFAEGFGSSLASGATAMASGLLMKELMGDEEDRHKKWERPKDAFEQNRAWKRNKMSANFMRNSEGVQTEVGEIRQAKEKELQKWIAKQEEKQALGRQVVGLIGKAVTAGAMKEFSSDTGWGSSVDADGVKHSAFDRVDAGLGIQQLGRNMQSYALDKQGYNVGDGPHNFVNDSDYAKMDKYNQLQEDINAHQGKTYWTRLKKKMSWTGRYTGGKITGPAGIDKVPAMLTEGEYVINANAARKIGIPALEKINAGRFNEGGLVGETTKSSEASSAGGMTNNINISVNVEGGNAKDGAKSGDSSESDQKTRMDDLSKKIKQQVVMVIKEENRPGGLLG